MTLSIATLFHYAERHIFNVLLNIVKLSVVKLNVIMLIVVFSSIVMLFVVC